MNAGSWTSSASCRLPSAIITLDEQVKRAYAQYQRQPTDLAKNVFLTALQDRNEVQFYRLLTDVVQQVQDAMWQPVYPQVLIKQEAGA